ncbi:M13 family metallopeptidase [Novosphingobium sp. Gsoil 351]|uniref:M13 family metallopeptidase n=1 Tax=Novosphingobium sp. Gsoil 351 TaxID=2675225 RepID=UPI0012B50068|nr:M13 family metallopeptidase [Novosphingobium sp. Gsoil 351]QGN53871.1 M13 family peptidase [Novosphingobium sp. Gsoil 351]
MNRKTLLAAVLLGATALAGPVACKMAGTDTAAVAPGTEAGIKLASMDKTIKPGDDFNAYANGNWEKTTEIPADRSDTGAHFVAFQETERQQNELLSGILKSSPAAGSNEAKIKDYYTAYMDQAGIDAAGLAPVQGDLARFSSITDKAQLSKVLGEQTRVDVDIFNSTDLRTENLLGLFVTQALTTNEVVPYILQGGLGMPEREYYLSNDPKMVDLRAKYKTYLVDMLTAAGMTDAPARAQRIFDLETKIARAHADQVAVNDFAKNGTLWQRADFATKAPGIDWDAYWAAAGLPQQQTFAAYNPGAISGLSALVASEPLDAWKDWLAFHQINSNWEVLPAKIDNLHFAFYGTALAGTPQQRPRDKRALAALNVDLGDALGKAYVDKYFPASAKATVEGMVGHIKDAFAKRVEGITTLAPETKKEALAKVKTIVVGVGYPDKWRDFSGYNADAKNAYANRIAAVKANTAVQLAKLGKPMDRNEWWMNPQLVNAVNLPVQNALNFPAAILQPPFFDPKADPAYNYGAIGAVIGHEISHSFDSSGALVDSTGKLRTWFTPEDLKNFEKQTKALADQYSAYAPFPDLHLNGEAESGENVADVVGLQAAYDAYRESLGGKEPPVIDGFTGDQRFFIAFAQSWATKMRDEALRGRVATDGHAPGQYRAQTVRNIDAWYTAFDVKPGDKLYLAPDKRVKIWG